MKVQKNYVVLSLLLMVLVVPLFAQTAYVHTTTNANRWVDSGAKAGTTWASTTNYIEILTSQTAQTIQGFGGCFCEIGWDAVSVLSAAGRDSVIRALFDTSGCNFTYCRMPIGANDFADGYYSLDDVSGDNQMTNFSLKRDSTKLIPFIKAAQAYKPNLRFWASPWTPPQWMKDNGNYADGHMKTDATTLTAYALYLSKAIQAFKACGINIEYITCQNEPDQCSQNYPTCCWNNGSSPAANEINFYKNYMIPRFQQDNLTTKIIVGVYCCGNYSDWITPFMNDATVKNSVGLLSHSWQDASWGSQAWTNYPSIPFIETEADWGQNGIHDWSEGVNQFNSMVSFLTNGHAAVFEQWNMILDQNYKSYWGFAQSAPIDINTSTKVVDYQPHFWAVKHITHYVKVDAKAVTTSLSGSNPGERVAFLNPNGDIVLVVSNAQSSAYQATIKVGNTMYKATFPANSFNTVLITTGTLARPAVVRKYIGTPVLSHARMSNSMLYFTLSDAASTHDIDFTLTDVQGRMVWTGHRTANAPQGDQLPCAIPIGRGNLSSGAYLLAAKIKDETGAVTTAETKIVAANRVSEN